MLNRTKIAQGYYQKGYGRGFKKAPNIYLIGRKLYAKDKAQAEVDFEPLKDELAGYVRINQIINPDGTQYFYQVSTTDEHIDYRDEVEQIEEDEIKELVYNQNFTIERKGASVPMPCYMFDYHNYAIESHKPQYAYHTTDNVLEKLKEPNKVFGMQHSACLVAHDNSEEIKAKYEAIRLEDGEVIKYNGRKYRLKLIGNFSDAVHFEEVQDGI